MSKTVVTLKPATLAAKPAVLANLTTLIITEQVFNFNYLIKIKNKYPAVVMSSCGFYFMGPQFSSVKRQPCKLKSRERSPLWSTICADLAHPAEQLICNQQVAGSSPAVGTIYGVVAQLGERLSGRQEVAGSFPVFSTIKPMLISSYFTKFSRYC